MDSFGGSEVFFDAAMFCLMSETKMDQDRTGQCLPWEVAIREETGSLWWSVEETWRVSEDEWESVGL